MDPMVKDCYEVMQEISNLSTDKAIPLLQKALSKIAVKYNTTGEKVFEKYMDWKASQSK